jgi:hypothetical protein
MILVFYLSYLQFVDFKQFQSILHLNSAIMPAG